MWSMPPPSQILMPVTAECVVSASNQYKVHPALLLSIMNVEGGTVGAASANSNKTFDLGPMQINTVHLQKLIPFGISAEKLKNNGCLNVHIGAYLLKKQEVDMSATVNKSSIWKAVANYHSKTQNLGLAYAQKVAKAYEKMPTEWKFFKCQTYQACDIKVKFENGFQVGVEGLMLAKADGVSQDRGQDGQEYASYTQLVPYKSSATKERSKNGR
jgi:Transglycosylase SLT domain